MGEPSIGEGEEIIRESRMWYYAPPSGIFGVAWKPGRLYLTNKRLLWCASYGNLRVEILVDKMTNVTVETRNFALRKSESVLAISYEAEEGEEIVIFSGTEREEWLKAIEKMIFRSQERNPIHHHKIR